jgi:putative endonuclease
MFTVYILYSDSAGRYYAGYTSGKVEDRLEKHLSDHGGFTAKAKDWKVVWTKVFEEKKHALTEEKRIKKRGAFRYLSAKL